MTGEVSVGAIGDVEFLRWVPQVICQVEEDLSCCVFILVWYTSFH